METESEEDPEQDNDEPEQGSDGFEQENDQEEEDYYVWNSTGPESETDRSNEWDSQAEEDSTSGGEEEGVTEEGAEKEIRCGWYSLALIYVILLYSFYLKNLIFLVFLDWCAKIRLLLGFANN